MLVNVKCSYCKGRELELQTSGFMVEHIKNTTYSDVVIQETGGEKIYICGDCLAKVFDHVLKRVNQDVL